MRVGFESKCRLIHLIYCQGLRNNISWFCSIFGGRGGRDFSDYISSSIVCVFSRNELLLVLFVKDTEISQDPKIVPISLYILMITKHL